MTLGIFADIHFIKIVAATFPIKLIENLLLLGNLPEIPEMLHFH